MSVIKKYDDPVMQDIFQTWRESLQDIYKPANDFLRGGCEGELNPNYKHGLSKTPEMIEKWAREAQERDPQRTLRHYHKNRDVICAKLREKYQTDEAHRERVKERRRLRHAEKKDEVNRRSRERYAENRDEERRKQRERYAARRRTQ